jgi:hypothetical protein
MGTPVAGHLFWEYVAFLLQPYSVLLRSAIADFRWILSFSMARRRFSGRYWEGSVDTRNTIVGFQEAVIATVR